MWEYRNRIFKNSLALEIAPCILNPTLTPSPNGVTDMAKTPTAKMPSAAKLVTIQTLIGAWRTAKLELSAAQTKESNLRAELRMAGFGQTCTEGVNPLLPVGHDCHLKLTGKINRSVDAAALTAYREQLNPQEHADAIELYTNMFEWKPSLVAGVWKAQTVTTKNIFADIVTEKEGSPTLELLVPDKAKGK